MTKQLKDNGLTVEIAKDNQSVKIILTENGAITGTETFHIADIMESPIFDLYLCKSINPMLSARNSGKSGLEKLLAFRDTWNDWLEGTFKREREKGAIRLVSAKAEALAEVLEVPLAKAQTLLKDATPDKVAYIFRKDSPAAKVLDRIEQERRDSKDEEVNLDSLLEGMESPE